MKPARRMRLFFRSFAVQGSFSYRQLIGPAFAWLLLPELRDRHGTAAGVDEDVRRHCEPFNSHPYLVGLAAGAVTRLEDDGADPAMVARFKEAVRGPLGGVGDRMVWSALRPTALLVALVLWSLNVAPWLIIASFLILYNGAHLWLRWWAVQAGFEAGPEVGARLRKAALGLWSERIIRLGGVLLGLFFGIVVSGSLSLGWTRGLAWTVVAVVALGVGLHRGARAGRPTRLGLAGIILLTATVGLL